MSPRTRSIQRIVCTALLVGAAVVLIVTAPKLGPDLLDKAAFDHDASCAQLPAASPPAGDCRTVSATVSDKGTETTYGRGGREIDIPYLVLALPGGSQSRVEVGEDLYDAALGPSGETATVQLFRGAPARVTIGDVSGDTSESPSGRVNNDGVGPLVAVLLAVVGALGLLSARRASPAPPTRSRP